MALLYLVAAFRRAYGVGWPGAAARAVPLFAVYVTIILVWLSVITACTLRHL